MEGGNMLNSNGVCGNLTIHICSLCLNNRPRSRLYLKPSNEIDSKFRFVILASKRAKQLLRGAKPKIKTKSRNLIRIAQDEVHRGLIDFEVVPTKEEVTFPAEDEMFIGEDLDLDHPAQEEVEPDESEPDDQEDEFEDADEDEDEEIDEREENEDEDADEDESSEEEDKEEE